MTELVLALTITGAQILLGIAMACSAYRALRGPRAQDRVLGLDALYLAGMLLLLTRGELAILSLLLDNARSVVSREDLLTVIRGEAAETVGRGVDLHISRLRRKIEAQSDQELIKTYRGVGYVLDAKVVIE